MAAHRGNQLYLELGKETTWGTVVDWATINPKHKVYGRGDNFWNVVRRPDREVLMTNVGHGRPLHVIRGINRIQGNFRTWAFPVTAQAMIEWATLLTSSQLPSYSARIDGGNQPLQYTGLVVRRLTMAAGSDVGAQALSLDYDLVGKDETEVTTFTESTSYDMDVPYVHRDATITIDGAARATCRSVSYEFTNTIDEGVGTGTALQWAVFGARQVLCVADILYDAATLKTKFEAGTLIALTHSLTHPKGAAYDLALNLQARVDIAEFTPQEPLAGRARGTFRFLALLDADPTGTDFTVTVS